MSDTTRKMRLLLETWDGIQGWVDVDVPAETTRVVDSGLVTTDGPKWADRRNNVGQFNLSTGESF